MTRVLLIGDSIRLGYQDVVRENLSTVAEIDGPKENGGNSEHILTHLEAWLSGRPFDLVHINCGLHDIKRDFGAEQNAVPLEAYTQNLRNIIDHLQGRHIAAVWAMTTPVNHERHKSKGFDRFEEDVTAYNNTAAEVMASHNVPVNDLFSVVMGAGRDRLLSADGVHFTSEGYNFLGNAVADSIRQHAKTSDRE